MKPETAAPPRTQALSDDDISVLANEVSILEFEEGEQIMTEGDEASWFGIVQSGSLEALIGSDVINVMGAGAVVGEMAFFTAGRRLATVRGVMSGYIAFIALQDVCAVLEERPETGASLMRIVGYSSIAQVARAPSEHPPPTANLPAAVYEAEAREVLQRCLIQQQVASQRSVDESASEISTMLEALQYRRFKRGERLLDRFACSKVHDGLLGFVLEGKVELECCGMLLGERGAGEVLYAIDFFDPAILPYDVVGGQGGGVLAWLKRSELQRLAEAIPVIYLSVVRWVGRTAIQSVKNGFLRRRPRLEATGGGGGTAGDLCDAAARGDLARLRSLAKEPQIDVSGGDYDQRTALHLAASEGVLDVVRCLVEELGATASPVDRWGGTPLDDAIRSQHDSVAAYLRTKGAEHGLTSKVASDGGIIEAAARGDLDGLRRLVEAGAKPDEGDYDQRTAMHLAAAEGNLDVVRCLVEELGASVSPVDRWGGTPLDDAIRSKHHGVTKWLQGLGAALGLTSKAATEGDIVEAAARGNLDMLRKLVEAGAKPDEGDYDKRTAMHLAASEGKLDVVRCLVEELGASHSPVDRWGGTPLDDATRSGHDAVTKWLRQAGAASGTTAKGTDEADFCSAAAAGNVETLRALVAVGGKPEMGDYDKRTPLHLAASEGHLEAVRCLVDELGVHRSPCDRWGFTPLDNATRSGHDHVIKFLVGRDALLGANTVAAVPVAAVPGADGDICDCALRGDVAGMRTIVNSGGDPKKGDYDQRTPLHVAASEGHLDVVRCLVDEMKVHKSPLDRWGNTPLDDAMRSKHAEVAMFLKSKGGGRADQKKKKKEAIASKDLAWAKKLNEGKQAVEGIKKEKDAAEEKVKQVEMAAQTNLLALQKMKTENKQLRHMHEQTDNKYKAERRKTHNLRLELDKVQESEERYKRLSMDLKGEVDRVKAELDRNRSLMEGSAISSVLEQNSELEAQVQQQKSQIELMTQQLEVAGDPEEMAELHRAVRRAQEELSSVRQSQSVAEQQREYARKALSAAQEITREASASQRSAEAGLQAALNDAARRELEAELEHVKVLSEREAVIRRQALGAKCLAGWCIVMVKRGRKARAEEAQRTEVHRRAAAKNRWVKVEVRTHMLRNDELQNRLNEEMAELAATKEELEAAREQHRAAQATADRRLACLPDLQEKLASERRLVEEARRQYDEQSALVELQNRQLATQTMKSATAQKRASDEKQRATATAAELARERSRAAFTEEQLQAAGQSLTEYEGRFGNFFRRSPPSAAGPRGSAVPLARSPPSAQGWMGGSDKLAWSSPLWESHSRHADAGSSTASGAFKDPKPDLYARSRSRSQEIAWMPRSSSVPSARPTSLTPLPKGTMADLTDLDAMKTALHDRKHIEMHKRA